MSAAIPGGNGSNNPQESLRSSWGLDVMIMKTAIPLTVLLFLASTLRAEDVPQFRGPGGLGVSKETKLPTNWSVTEGVRWKADLPGRGLSNPVSADGRVYVTATAAYQQKRQV